MWILKKRMNSLTLSMSRQHRNNFSGTFISPAPISRACCLAFCICRLEMSGISCWSSAWLYLTHKWKYLNPCRPIFRLVVRRYYSFYPSIKTKVLVGLSCDKWCLITDCHRGSSFEGATVLKTRVIASWPPLSFMYCLFVFSDVSFQS